MWTTLSATPKPRNEAACLQLSTTVGVLASIFDE
jgi:hypothetical protein